MVSFTLTSWIEIKPYTQLNLFSTCKKTLNAKEWYFELKNQRMSDFYILHISLQEY